MASRIYFMKIGPYSVGDGKDKFRKLSLLTTQRINPPLSECKIWNYLPRNFDFRKIDLVISSDLLRAKGTAKFLRNNFLRKEIKIIYTPLLREILFDVADLCSEEEYKLFGSDIIRKMFIEHFAQDRLLEKHNKILDQFNELRKFLDEHNSRENILLVSHTFFIKLFFDFLRNRESFHKSTFVEDIPKSF